MKYKAIIPAAVWEPVFTATKAQPKEMLQF